MFQISSGRVELIGGRLGLRLRVVLASVKEQLRSLWAWQIIGEELYTISRSLACLVTRTI